MLTKKQIQAYLQSPVHCPYCGSQDIVGRARDYEGNYVYQGIKCQVCGRTWTDEYTLTGITEEPEEGRTDE